MASLRILGVPLRQDTSIYYSAKTSLGYVSVLKYFGDARWHVRWRPYRLQGGGIELFPPRDLFEDAVHEANRVLRGVIRVVESRGERE